ncbi:MAG: SBBP repeat-containing protein, partial [bacterium]|nr:SBBP repeat-containing protein [bacterium]
MVVKIIGFWVLFFLVYFYWGLVSHESSSTSDRLNNFGNHGKVSNNFGKMLNRDIDNDGDNDSAVILDGVTGLKSDEQGNSIFIDKYGKIYITGSSYNNRSYNDLIVVRLNSDGSLDKTFDSDGYLVMNSITGVNSTEEGNSIFVDGEGKIYVTGYASNGKDYDLVILKLNPDGSLDKTFVSNGCLVINNIAGDNLDDVGTSIFVDDKNKVYITGYSFNGKDNDLIVLKLNQDGSMDKSFDFDGVLILDNLANGQGADQGNSISMDSLGNVYITGFSMNLSGFFSSIVLKLDSNGLLDKSFGANGFTVVWERGIGNSVLLDNHSRIYVTGEGEIENNNFLLISRLNSDGSKDIDFESPMITPSIIAYSASIDKF